MSAPAKNLLKKGYPFNKMSTISFRFSLLILVSALLSFNSFAQTNDSTLTIAQTKKINSKILGEERTLYIRTPSKMKTNETFPVIYILDGEAFTQMSGGQLQYLSEPYKIIPSMIVVGI